MISPNHKGSLATTSFITVPAVIAIAPSSDANHSLFLVRRRINAMTAICGTLSVSTLGLAFLFGSKHGYLVYAGATAAILLRNQRETMEEIGNWIKDEYYVAKEFISQYAARKSGHRTVVKKSSEKPAVTAGQHIPP